MYRKVDSKKLATVASVLAETKHKIDVVNLTEIRVPHVQHRLLLTLN